MMIDGRMTRDEEKGPDDATTRAAPVAAFGRRSLFIEFIRAMLRYVIGLSLIRGDVKATPRISRDYTLRDALVGGAIVP